MRRLFAVVPLVLALAAGAARAGEAPLEAGFGRRSLVTEQRGVTLGGYGGRGFVSAQGVHDPPLAKAVVLRTPGRAVAIVALDLIGVQRTILEALRVRGFPDRVRLAPEDVLLAASHTHSSFGSLARPSGALGLDALFLATCGPFDQAFFDEVVEKIRAAIVDAWDDLAPARIGVGAEEVLGLARNRGRRDGPVDPEVGVIVLERPDGAVRGIVVNFAGHPVIVDGDRLVVSAEYPGAMERALEARFPGACALFTQGAEGDVTATVPAGVPREDDWARMEATGRRLAEHVARIAAGIETAPAIALESRRLACDMPAPADGGAWIKFLGGAPRSIFQQVVLGDTLLMGIPGEPCCRIGLDLKEAARGRGFRHAFVVGLAQDHCGYFVHAEDYAPGREASHEYEKRLNFYGPGVGEFFRRVHFEMLDPRPLAGGGRGAARF
jgi:hypothetical protein